MVYYFLRFHRFILNIIVPKHFIFKLLEKIKNQENLNNEKHKSSYLNYNSICTFANKNKSLNLGMKTKLTSLIILLFIVVSCNTDCTVNKDISNIPMDVEVVRFDKAFAEATTEAVNSIIQDVGDVAFYDDEVTTKQFVKNVVNSVGPAFILGGLGGGAGSIRPRDNQQLYKFIAPRQWKQEYLNIKDIDKRIDYSEKQIIRVVRNLFKQGKLTRTKRQVTSGRPTYFYGHST